MTMKTGTLTNPALAQELLDAIDAQFGLHPGFRPAHAKGLMCSGMFRPSAEAVKLTRAPHASRPSTAVTVRYSNSTGVPTIPDNDPRRSGPRGMAIRFHLAEHDHTDIVAHSTDGFPVRTGEEFVHFSAPWQPPRGAARGARHVSRRPPEREAVRRDGQADPDQLRPGGVLRRHVVQVHKRRRREPSRAVSDPARSRDRVSLQRRRSGEVRDLPLRRARPEARQGAGPARRVRANGGARGRRRRCQCDLARQPYRDPVRHPHGNGPRG